MEPKSTHDVPRLVRAPADRLRKGLRSRRFLLTAELECLRSASAGNVRRQARAYAPFVDAIDCTDNSAAVVRMSPVAAAAIAREEAPVVLVQLTCRDRNRLALEAEILGAAAVGAAGIVCMGGDPPESGSEPQARGVYELSTFELMATVRRLKQGRFSPGEPLGAPASRRPPGPNEGRAGSLRSWPIARKPHDMVIGCVENPAEGERSLERLAAKAAAGADFVQTQIVFDVDVLARWMERVRAEKLHERLRVLAGVAPLRRLSVARFLQDRVAGVAVPEALLRRLEQADDAEAEGVAIAAEILRAARQIEGIAGVHLMTFGWAGGVGRVVEAAGPLT